MSNKTYVGHRIWGEAIDLFEEYVQLQKVKFHRSLMPASWRGKPYGIMFSDGSDKTYGETQAKEWMVG